MTTVHSTKNTGFSIVELMIAMLLGAFLILSIISIFTQSNRNQIQDNQLSVVQQNGRFAVRAITRTLSLGGFFGGIPDAGGITIEAGVVINGCNAWALNLTSNPLSLINNASAADYADYSCVDTSQLIDDTDGLAVLRVADNAVTALSATGTYLAANSATGILFQGATPPSTIVAPAEIWRFFPEIFYIIDQPDAAGNSIPTLCRYAIKENTSEMMQRCLADGIENMQIEFGIDINNDFVADYYDNDPSVADQANAVSAKVYILARSLTEIPGYVNNKTYNLGLTAIPAANDGFLRRVFAASIELKNSSKLSVTPIQPSS